MDSETDSEILETCFNVSIQMFRPALICNGPAQAALTLRRLPPQVLEDSSMWISAYSHGNVPVAATRASSDPAAVPLQARHDHVSRSTFAHV
jgi:hypothetical protein